MHESLYQHTQDYVQQKNDYILQVESLKGYPEKATETYLADLDFIEELLYMEQYKVPSIDEIAHHIRRIKSTADRLKYCQELYSEIGLYAEEHSPAKFDLREDNADIADIYRYYEGLISLQNRIDLEISYLSEDQGETEQETVLEPVEIVVDEEEVQPSLIHKVSVDELSKRKRLNTHEGAIYMGISEKTLRNRIADGTIPSDVFRGKGKGRIFLRSKLDLLREGKLTDSSQYLKVNWLKNKYTLDAFLEWFSGRFTDMNMKDLKSNFTTGTSEVQSVSEGINWVMPSKETNHKSLVMLASLLVQLHRHSYIDLGVHGTSFKLRPFMTEHFRLNGKRISTKTATDAIAEIRSDEDDGYIPYWEPFDELFSEYLPQNEILRRIKADSAK